MRPLSFEHGRAAYHADFLLYGAAVAALSALLIVAGPRDDGPAMAGAMLGGLIGWSLAEYLLHRFVLHRLPPFRHWHEQHHRRPTALICTPTLVSASLIAVLVFLPAAVLADPWMAGSLTLGLLIGYLAYALTHHAIHHARGNGAWLQRRKHRHAAHHRLAGGPGCYGVTTSFWDRVFGTGRSLPELCAAPRATTRPDAVGVETT